LSKEWLIERLWQEAFVTEASLANLVSSLRKTIGDIGDEHQLVRTVHGFGYAFCGKVEGDGEPPAADSAGVFRLWVMGREIVLREGENVLGRAPEATAWIDDDAVSRRHARVLLSAGAATLEDLGSKNGTFLNGRRLEAPAPLADRDEIRIGAARMVLRILPAGGSTRTATETLPHSG
jgi:hypothetical protein